MKRLTGYIVAACVCIMGIFSCTRGDRLIPKSDLAEIYAEMFVVDNWIASNRLQRAADTSAVYAPILEKYGYTVGDFRYSVQKYMRNPESFAKVFDHSTKILKLHVDYLVAEEQRIHRLDSLKRLHEQLSLINKVPLYRNMLNPPYGHVIRMDPDSCGMLIPSLTADTLYMGPKMVIASDSIAIEADVLTDGVQDEPRNVPAKPLIAAEAIIAEEELLPDEISESK